MQGEYAGLVKQALYEAPIAKRLGHNVWHRLLTEMASALAAMQQKMQSTLQFLAHTHLHLTNDENFDADEFERDLRALEGGKWIDTETLLIELRQKVGELEREVERLTAIVDERFGDAAKVSLVSAGPDPHGRFGFNLKSAVVPLIAAHVAETFKANGGKNFVEVEMDHEELGPLILSIQRRFGKLPAQIAAEATARAEAAESALQAEKVKYVKAGIEAAGNLAYERAEDADNSPGRTADLIYAIDPASIANAVQEKTDDKS